MTLKEKQKKALENELKTLRAIKKEPVIEGYFVISYSELARKIGMHVSTFVNAVRRLERKGIIKIKESVALFGSMYKRGIKIVKEEK